MNYQKTYKNTKKAYSVLDQLTGILGLKRLWLVSGFFTVFTTVLITLGLLLVSQEIWASIQELDNSTNQMESVVQLPATLGEQQADYIAQVVAIVDGDTIKIMYQGEVRTVRLLAIDTPETVHPQKPVECFGRDASAEMSQLLQDEEVVIAFDSTQSKTDRYGRLLLYIWRKSDNLFINEYMVKKGFAQVYESTPPALMQVEFTNLEEEARAQERGLWGDVCQD